MLWCLVMHFHKLNVVTSQCEKGWPRSSMSWCKRFPGSSPEAATPKNGCPCIVAHPRQLAIAPHGNPRVCRRGSRRLAASAELRALHDPRRALLGQGTDRNFFVVGNEAALPTWCPGVCCLGGQAVHVPELNHMQKAPEAASLSSTCSMTVRQGLLLPSKRSTRSSLVALPRRNR